MSRWGWQIIHDRSIDAQKDRVVEFMFGLEFWLNGRVEEERRPVLGEWRPTIRTRPRFLVAPLGEEIDRGVFTAAAYEAAVVECDLIRAVGGDPRDPQTPVLNYLARAAMSSLKPMLERVIDRPGIDPTQIKTAEQFFEAYGVQTAFLAGPVGEHFINWGLTDCTVRKLSSGRYDAQVIYRTAISFDMLRNVQLGMEATDG